MFTRHGNKCISCPALYNRFATVLFTCFTCTFLPYTVIVKVWFLCNMALYLGVGNRVNLQVTTGHVGTQTVTILFSKVAYFGLQFGGGLPYFVILAHIPPHFVNLI